MPILQSWSELVMFLQDCDSAHTQSACIKKPINTELMRKKKKKKRMNCSTPAALSPKLSVLFSVTGKGDRKVGLEAREITAWKPNSPVWDNQTAAQQHSALFLRLSPLYCYEIKSNLHSKPLQLDKTTVHPDGGALNSSSYL